MIDLGIIKDNIKDFVSVAITNGMTTIEIDENMMVLMICIVEQMYGIRPKLFKNYVKQNLNDILRLLQSGDDIEADIKDMIDNI